MRAMLGAISERILGAIYTAQRDDGFDEVVSELRRVRVELSDLSFLFSDMKDYDLSVAGHDIPDDLQVIRAMIPIVIANLALSGKSKPSRERSSRERAAITLLPLWVEEIYDVSFSDPPKFTGKDISIEPA